MFLNILLAYSDRLTPPLKKDVQTQEAKSVPVRDLMDKASQKGGVGKLDKDLFFGRFFKAAMIGKFRRHDLYHSLA